MSILFAIVGAVVGAILGNAGGGSLGLVLGAVVGILLTRHTAVTQANFRLVERIERLEAAARLAEKIEVSSPAASERVPPADKPTPEPTPESTHAPTFVPSPEPSSSALRRTSQRYNNWLRL